MDSFFFLPVGIIAKGLILAGPIVSTALFITTVSSEDPSIALVAILAVCAVSLTAAYVLQFLTRRLAKKAENPSQSELTYEKLFKILEDLLRPSVLNISLLHSSGVVLFAILAIRLDATDQFGGAPQRLDFGLKGYGDGMNIGLTNSSSTYGHVVQGIISALLASPAVSGSIARIFSSEERSAKSFVLRKPSMPVMSACQLVSAVLTIYPTYSLLKRLNKDADQFSRTSHMNNAAEWVLGYILGVSVGWLVTVLVQKDILKLSGVGDSDGSKLSQVVSCLKSTESDEIDASIKYGYGKVTDYAVSSKAYRVITYISAFFLVLLSLATLATGILTGLTWNADEVELKDKIDQDMIAKFFCIWFIITFVFSWFALKKWPLNKL